MLKKCCTCKTDKNIAEFYKNRRSKDGFQNRCKNCSKKNGKVYWEENKELLEPKKKVYRKKNKDNISSYYKNYYSNNKGKIIKRWEDYRKENPEKIRNYQLDNLDKRASYEAKRRARKLNATPKWANIKKIEMLYKKAKWLGSLTGLKYEVDHIIPLKSKNVCGLHIWQNLQILEKTLNRRKSNKIKQ